MALSLTPACLPFLRGSLPHGSAAAAITAQLAAMPDLLSWPSLPHVSFRETVLAQTVYGLPGAVVDNEHKRVRFERGAAERGIDRVALSYLRGDEPAAGLPDEYTTGLDALLGQLGPGRTPQALKAELLGPVSLSLLLSDEQSLPLANDPVLRELVLQHLALRITWVDRQLSARSDQTLICLDEPFLDALNNPLCPLDWADGAELLQRALAAAPSGCGLIVGAGVAWEHILALPLELVVFDAFEHSGELLPFAPALVGFIERGGLLGWGLIPNDALVIAHERPDMLAERFSACIDQLTAATDFDPQRIVSASLITHVAPLDNLTPDEVTAALQLCAATASLIQSNYGLTRHKE